MEEIEELRTEMRAKKIMMRMLERERDTAQETVDRERAAYQEVLVDEQSEEVIQQLDPRFLDGLSSEVGNINIDEEEMGIETATEDETEEETEEHEDFRGVAIQEGSVTR